MKKMIPLALSSLMLLGATACSENPNTAITDDNDVRTNQIESDGRARDQRDRTNSDTANTANTDSEVRNDQIESDARARDQRDRTNSATNSQQQTTGDLAVDVRNSLESNLPGSRLAVDVDNGMATIDGTVTSQEQFDEIEPTVMAFEGIRSVDIKAEVNAN